MIRKYFKNKNSFDRIIYMHPIALMIMFDAINYLDSHSHIAKITSTVSTKAEDYALKRTRNTHLSGRAFDLSVEGMNSDLISSLKKYLNDKYKSKYGAVVNTKQRKLIVDHVGTARHLHIQIHSDYSSDIDVVD